VQLIFNSATEPGPETHLSATCLHSLFILTLTHSHFFTRCIATTMLKVTSLKSQGYTGDGSLPRFRMQAGGGWVIVVTYSLKKKYEWSHTASYVSLLFTLFCNLFT
jgi:hypothetical protein